MLFLLQMANLTNMALDKLVAAGVVLVPFDSSPLDQAIAVSWGGGPESIGYELPDALARYEHCLALLPSACASSLVERNMLAEMAFIDARQVLVCRKFNSLEILRKNST